MTLDEALEWARRNNGDEVVSRLRSRQVVVELAAEIDRLRAENAALRKDAERYRHAKAHGWPMSGPQCIAWTNDRQMVLADTPEAAIDAAMARGAE